MILRSFFNHNIVGIHYTVRIGVGTTALWFLTQGLHATSTLWAIISLIIVTEPQMHMAWLAFRSRMLNTLMGALVGFTVLVWAGPNSWTMIAAITFSAFLSTYINKGQQGWRLAPITTALVVSAGISQSVENGLYFAFTRAYEVFLGSLVALIVSVVMARIWLPPVPAGAAEKK